MKLIRALLIATTVLLSSLVANPSVSDASTAPSLMSFKHVAVTYSTDTVQSSPVYIVKPGDSLSSIAARYNLQWQALWCENEKVIGSNPNVIYAGEKLVIAVGKCTSGGTITTTTSYVSGSPQSIAWNLLPIANRAAEYSCLSGVIMIESGWNIHAYNPSGAYGIPQALPGSKMAGSWGSDWENSAYVQLYWMIREYIPDDYGDACGALEHEHVFGWY